MEIQDWILLIIVLVWIIGAMILSGIAAATCKENQMPNIFFIMMWPIVLVLLPFFGIELLTEWIVKKIKNKENRL